MVYYRTTAELNNAFGNMIGLYNYMDHIHNPDTEAALQHANLQPGHSVLELGAGGGRFISKAKQRVGAGFCVAVDAVQGFLNVDVTWALNRNGLSVYPAGTPHGQVHLLHANITDNDFADAVRALPGAPQRFDRIVALHVFTTIPADQRLHTLVRLRSLLTHDGLLILNTTARFTDTPPTPADATLPVQFRASPHTEAPGSDFKTVFLSGPPVAVPRGGNYPAKIIIKSLQLAPDRLWVMAATQAREAAMHAGFVVHRVFNMAKANNFNLPHGLHSPSQDALDNMTNVEFSTAIQHISEPNGWGCKGRILESRVRKYSPGWNQASLAERDSLLVLHLQSVVHADAQIVQMANNNLPSGGLGGVYSHDNVGVMLVLGKL